MPLQELIEALTLDPHPKLYIGETKSTGGDIRATQNMPFESYYTTSSKSTVPGTNITAQGKNNHK